MFSVPPLPSWDDSSSADGIIEADDDKVAAIVFLIASRSSMLKDKRPLMAKLVDRGFNLDTGTEADYEFQFRFSRAEIEKLVELFELPERLPLRCDVSGFKGLCIVLHRFS